VKKALSKEQVILGDDQHPFLRNRVLLPNRQNLDNFFLLLVIGGITQKKPPTIVSGFNYFFARCRPLPVTHCTLQQQTR